jgi:hypothetical protein
MLPYKHEIHARRQVISRILDEVQLPAITPPKKKSPLSSRVLKFGALAVILAGTANVSAMAVCAKERQNMNLSELSQH